MPDRGLECPVKRCLLSRMHTVDRIGSWVWSAHPNPSDQIIDLNPGKLPLWRHSKVVVQGLNRLDHRAFFRMPRDNALHPGLAAASHPLLGVKQQTALDFPGGTAVAFVAMLSEDWPDPGFEKINAFQGISA